MVYGDATPLAATSSRGQMRLTQPTPPWPTIIGGFVNVFRSRNAKATTQAVPSASAWQ
jgi:hypothetical protein